MGDFCALTYAHRHLRSRLLRPDICAPSFASQHMCTNNCAPTFSRQHLRSDNYYVITPRHCIPPIISVHISALKCSRANVGAQLLARICWGANVGEIVGCSKVGYTSVGAHMWESKSPHPLNQGQGSVFTHQECAQSIPRIKLHL